MKTLRIISLGVLAFLASACLKDVDAPSNKPDVPTISVDKPSVTRVSMLVTGTFGNDMSNIESYGVEVSETLFEEGKTYQTLVPQEVGPDGFSLGITDLASNKTYYLRSFVSNGKNKMYSATVSQKTPETSIASVSDVNLTNGSLVATIEDTGGRTIEEVGFVWSENSERKGIRREKRYIATLEADKKTFSLPASLLGQGTHYVLAYVQDNKSGTGFSRLAYEHVVDDQPHYSRYLTFSSDGTTTISLSNYGDNAPVLYYSRDAYNWEPWDYSELTFTQTAPLYICGNNPNGFSTDLTKYSTFTASGDLFAVTGSVMSLLDNENELLTIPNRHCFKKLFNLCTSLSSAPELPATTITEDCYWYMFEGCSNLISAPDLPAKTLTKSCYADMFSKCTSLTSAPELPATTLAEYCYSFMFYGCTSLASAPELPATTIEDYCYMAMFAGCTSLTSAPVLPAPLLVQECYYQMFANCRNINYVQCLATDISASECLTDWLVNVSPTGIFAKAAGMNDWPTGASGIPQGWTVISEDDVPSGGNEGTGEEDWD